MASVIRVTHHSLTIMSEKILVVEDDIDILDLVEMSLTADGFEVVTAENGLEALTQIQEEPPDLIILDLMMPQMDGYELMNILKTNKETNAIPVIILTAAKTEVNDKIKGLSIGADDYITKPFAPRELTARIEAVLSRTRATKYINPLMQVMGDVFTEEGVEQLGHHLETAARIQQRLLPREAPQYDNIEIAGVLHSSMMVAGDFYDFIPLDDDRLGIAIADIRGKGVPAAMLMVMVRTILRMVCREEMSPAGVLKRINDFLEIDTDPEIFTTMVYGILDTKSLTFTYANAGHCLPIKVNASNEAADGLRPDSADFLKEGGLILGVFDFASFESETISLDAGDILVFYTDGITETENAQGEIYGAQRLMELISQYAALSSKELCRKIEEALTEFSGTQQRSDDLTLVVIKIRD